MDSAQCVNSGRNKRLLEVLIFDFFPPKLEIHTAQKFKRCDKMKKKEHRKEYTDEERIGKQLVALVREAVSHKWHR